MLRSLGLYWIVCKCNFFRSGISKPPRIDIDMHSASMSIFSIVSFELGGKGVNDPGVLGRTAYLDTGNNLEAYRVWQLISEHILNTY